jgi:aspartate/glutamate/glutamine transport system permease protein
VQLGKLFEPRHWEGFTDTAIWQFILTGLQVTVLKAMVSIVASLIFGTLLALARLSRNRALNKPATVYIELIRALPLLYLIFFVYFGGARFGLREPFFAATLALIAYSSAVNVRLVRLVVLPQAFRRVIRPQVSQLVALIKDTSLAYIVGTTELMRRIFILYSGFETGVGVIQGLFVVSCIYFVLNFALSRLDRWLELRGAGSPFAAAPAAQKVAAAEAA